MGRLLELVFEVFFEGLVELVGYVYIKLMTMIVPEKAISERVKHGLKVAVTTFSAILMIVLIVGLILLIQEDPGIKNIGRYMTWIPLGIMGIQVGLGILVKFLSRGKKTDKGVLPSGSTPFLKMVIQHTAAESSDRQQSGRHPRCR